jgi:hypothetical protein
MILDFAADAADLSFGDDIAGAQQDYLVRDDVHFMQYVAGDDDVAALAGK